MKSKTFMRSIAICAAVATINEHEQQIIDFNQPDLHEISAIADAIGVEPIELCRTYTTYRTDAITIERVRHAANVVPMHPDSIPAQPRKERQHEPITISISNTIA